MLQKAEVSIQGAIRSMLPKLKIERDRYFQFWSTRFSFREHAPEIKTNFF